MDDLTGYVSPIEMLCTAVRMQTEEHQGQILMKTVQEAGFDVDKDELMKALRYDRHQYEKGYADAMKNAVPIDKMCEWLDEYCWSCPKYHPVCIEGEDKECKDCWREVLTKWKEGLDAAD